MVWFARRNHLDIEHIGVQNGPMTLESDVVWIQATRELARALRGHRSQVAFSRRLGYRSNVAADWESGRRSPTAAVVLRAMERVGVDVAAGFAAFHGPSAPVLQDGLPAWLDALRGHTPQAQVARRAGRSRHQVRRWLSGEAAPRLPDFLALLDALTGRAPDWVSHLVDIERVPSLCGAHQTAQAAARLAYDRPWSSAVRVLIESDAYRADPTPGFLSRALGVSPHVVTQAVDALVGSGLAERTPQGLRPVSTFTADARASPDDRRKLKAHWSRVAADRAETPRGDELISVNLFALSQDDLERVRALQRAYFRELRSLVAASPAEQVAALVVMQVVPLSPALDSGSD
jgi:transcriptional regulator with XRE-family HTH domain